MKSAERAVADRVAMKYFIPIYWIFIFVIYINLINSSPGFDWDASNIASWADEGRYVFPRQQNHLLQSALNLIWCNIWRFFGWQRGCLVPLRFLSCIFGASGVVGFFVLLNRIFRKKEIALFGSLGLAFCYFWWVFSTELETHLLPASLFIYCLILLFDADKGSYKNTVLLGLLHSVCIFLSGIYIFFTPAVLVGIMTASGYLQTRYKRAGCYLLSLAFFWLIPFFFAGIYFYYSSSSLKYATNVAAHIYIWFRGFERLIPFSFSNLSEIPRCYFFSIHYINRYSRWTIIAGLLFSVFYAVFFYSFLRRAKIFVKNFFRVVLIALCIIIPYQLILLIYEPVNAQRYTHFLSAVWLLLCCLTYPLFLDKQKFKQALPFIFVTLIFFCNLVFYILPRHLLILGPAQREILGNLYLQADSFYRQGDYAKAIERYEKAYRQLIGTFDQSNPEVKRVSDKMAVLYDKIYLKEYLR